MSSCRCGHARSNHRQAYGEPYIGACRSCRCVAYAPANAKESINLQSQTLLAVVKRQREPGDA